MIDCSLLFHFPSSPTHATLTHFKLIIGDFSPHPVWRWLGNDLPIRLVILALHCLSCLALPGCPGFQHFDCSDFSLTLSFFVCLLSFVCLCVCRLRHPSLDRHPRLGALPIGHFCSDPLGSDILRSVSLDRTPSVWPPSHRPSSPRSPGSLPGKI